MDPRQPPVASRPNLDGYGIAPANEGDGLLPWSWAQGRLADCRNYLLATVTHPEGAEPRPHLMVVWGVWLEDTFQFSTDPKSRKGKNLEKNPRCVVSIEDGTESVIVEGSAAVMTEGGAVARFMKAYETKYAWDMSKHTQPVYVVTPRLVFGQIEETYTKSATRWSFGAAG